MVEEDSNNARYGVSAIQNKGEEAVRRRDEDRTYLKLEIMKDHFIRSKKSADPILLSEQLDEALDELVSIQDRHIGDR